jgi:hypothetical protein
MGSTGINPEVENLLKYFVSSDGNIFLIKVMLIFQWEVGYHLTVGFSKVGSLMNSWHISGRF